MSNAPSKKTSVGISLLQKRKSCFIVLATKLFPDMEMFSCVSSVRVIRGVISVEEDESRDLQKKIERSRLRNASFEAKSKRSKERSDLKKQF